MTSPKNRDILKSCHVALVTDLEPEMLFAHLIHEGIMISDDQEEITKIARRTRRNEEFLSILSRRGPTAYQEFVKALEENQSMHVTLANCSPFQMCFKSLLIAFKDVRAKIS